MRRAYGHMAGNKAAIQIAKQALVAATFAGILGTTFKVTVMDECKDRTANYYAKLEKESN